MKHFKVHGVEIDDFGNKNPIDFSVKAKDRDAAELKMFDELEKRYKASYYRVELDEQNETN